MPDLFTAACLPEECPSDRARLVALPAWQVQRQDAIAVFRLDIVGIDIDRQRHSAVEPSRKALAAAHRRFVAVLDTLAPRNPQRVALDFDVEVRFTDTGYLDDRDDVVTLSEHVQRRVSASRAGPRSSQPLDRNVSSARWNSRNCSNGSKSIGI